MNQSGNCEETGKRFKSEWKEEWHRFIDKLASGGTVEEFFKDLLGGKM